ncbi:UNVERIFIED_CONTAM: class F sortase [Halobacillus marinus]
MRHIVYSLALGCLVFFISLLLLNTQEEEEGVQVLSVSEDSSTSEDIESAKEREAPIKKNYEQAVTVHNRVQEGIVPSRLVIPSLGVDAPVRALGYTEEGGMAVPDNITDVGWFEPGTKPGNQGNAVIAGHVDGKSGPGVFYDLKDLSSGEVIEVYDRTGQKKTFIVSQVAAYPYEDAPIRDLFGPSNQASLNLITCTGPYDADASTYSKRLVIYSVAEKTSSTSDHGQQKNNRPT